VKRKRRFESVIERSLLFSASISVISVAFITFFIFMQGLPLFAKVNPLEFIFSMRWEPSSKTNPGFGILSFIVGSLYVTLGALLIAVPVGVACGIFLAELATGRLRDLLRTVVELLAGIPSVIYGLFGIVFICGMVREVFGGNGYSVLSASIILAIMTLPTIINITEVSIRMVPREYYEGSLALGATHWQTIVRVLLVGGNAPIMPDGPLSMVRTLTMNIITDMSYASGDHMTALFSTSMVLFIFILVLNLSVQFFLKRSIEATAGNG
jgi:phosphate transport system permease protein